MSENSTRSTRAGERWDRLTRASGKVNVSDLPLAQVVSLAEETPMTASEVSLERRGGNSYLISRA